MEFTAVLLLFIGVLATLAYHNVKLLIWDVVIVGYLALVTVFSAASTFGLMLLWLITLLFLIPLNIRRVKDKYITTPLFNYAKKLLPPLSDTEEQAINAGTVNWDGEVFSGHPNWNMLFKYAEPKLTKEEEAFLNGPTEQLCQLVKPWDCIIRNDDSPKELVDFIRYNKFMAMIIPKEYGGLDYSALAQSEVQIKYATRSTVGVYYIGVPNSLGPAELITKYGTQEQIEHYLPRLADGTDIPCFALTGPHAGSDAGSLPDNGVVCKGKHEGKEVIGIRLNFKKHYITLAPVATLMGLAFKLDDPDHLIGDQDHYGITCALIPTDHKGISIGRRHVPLRQAFPNGPIQGEDVFIPVDWIIGGPKMAGRGWQMLIECLSVGRVVTLPTIACAGAKVASYTCGYYARVRKQFGTSIGEFEGIQEALAQIAGYTFIIDATRLFTMGAVGRGEKPAVPSAISKYHCTELSRKIGTCAMDIHGGKGIMMGPKNYLAHGFMGNPIAITVEGANILTRNMMIFGQGVTRCHPYLLDEMLSLRDDNKERFAKSVLMHVSHSISNMVRSFVLGLTDGRLIRTPKQAGNMGRYIQRMTRYSSILAFVSDVALLTLGGSLKRREAVSARLGDILSMLYIGSAVLKRFDELEHSKELEPVVHWSMQYLLHEAQTALHNVLLNFPVRGIGALLRVITLPLGRRYHAPSDKLRKHLARQLMHSDELREVLTRGMYIPDDKENSIVQLRDAVEKLEETKEVEKKVRVAIKEGKIDGHYFDESIRAASKIKLITKQEEKELLEAYDALLHVITVDDFDRKDVVID